MIHAHDKSSRPSNICFASIEKLYALADMTTDIELSNAYSDAAAGMTYTLAANVPTNIDEAIDAFRLAQDLLPSDGAIGRLVEHAYVLTKADGQTIEAVIALREALLLIELHEDHRVEIDLVSGLIAWMTKPRIVG